MHVNCVHDITVIETVACCFESVHGTTVIGAFCRFESVHSTTVIGAEACRFESVYGTTVIGANCMFECIHGTTGCSNYCKHIEILGQFYILGVTELLEYCFLELALPEDGPVTPEICRNLRFKTLFKL